MKILHVEDDDHTVSLVDTLCGDLDVHSVSSLFGAKEVLKQERFDLLLVDLNLGDSFGMDTVRELQSFGIPMIVLTADPTEAFVKEAAEIGVADYIHKINLSRVDLPLRFQFVYSRNLKQQSKKSVGRFQGSKTLSPFLTCSVLA